MGKKDKKDKFNSPFSQLKGLSVSSQEIVPEEIPQKVASPEPAPEPVDDGDRFAQAMGQLGVRQAAQDEVLEKPTPVVVEGDVSVEPACHAGNEPLPPGSRRKNRKIVQRLGEPEASLDLHGVAAADCIRKVEWFLENALFHGCHVVRIVTGKGSHSEAGSVLKPLVEGYLTGDGQKLVSAWVAAPRDQGGEGALHAELRGTDELD